MSSWWNMPFFLFLSFFRIKTANCRSQMKGEIIVFEGQLCSSYTCKSSLPLFPSKMLLPTWGLIFYTGYIVQQPGNQHHYPADHGDIQNTWKTHKHKLLYLICYMSHVWKALLCICNRAAVDCRFTFSPALGSSLWLLQWRQQSVQEVKEALQHTAVTQGPLANAGQEHEHPGMKQDGKYRSYYMQHTSTTALTWMSSTPEMFAGEQVLSKEHQLQFGVKHLEKVTQATSLQLYTTHFSQCRPFPHHPKILFNQMNSIYHPALIFAI